MTSFYRGCGSRRSHNADVIVTLHKVSSAITYLSLGRYSSRVVSRDSSQRCRVRGEDSTPSCKNYEDGTVCIKAIKPIRQCVSFSTCVVAANSRRASARRARQAKLKQTVLSVCAKAEHMQGLACAKIIKEHTVHTCCISQQCRAVHFAAELGRVSHKWHRELEHDDSQVHHERLTGSLGGVWP